MMNTSFLAFFHLLLCKRLFLLAPREQLGFFLAGCFCERSELRMREKEGKKLSGMAECVEQEPKRRADHEGDH
jgi:hypothetical protein